ncbi:MAG: metal ABC transporter substrate-binding protein [Myxococcales bacterium]|jgi:zinc/manganese transport system substrate-binding protein|nr:metal ABC transporter substrate-binding protein [Myxococcales bacterium]
MKRTVLSMFFSLIATLSSVSAFADSLEVVATVPALASLAQEIGGDQIKVTSLSLPTQDPHFIDARPSLALALNRADLLLFVGLELEQGWLPTLMTSARNGKIQPGASGYLDCSSVVERLGVSNTALDRRMGDVHPAGNPHYLFDPRNALRVAQAIAERLAAIDPENAASYQTRLESFQTDLSQRIAAWEARMVPFKGAPIIAYHSSWLYLATWLGLTEVAFIEPKPGIAPTPAHVAQVLAIGRAKGVRAILQETFYADSASRLIAEKIPARLLRLSAGPDVRGGESYAAQIEKIVSALEAALLPQAHQAEVTP